jgi:uncharacterized protein with PQ loop repeat
MHIDDLVLNALGFAATGFSVLMWIPQARTTWLNRNDPLKLAGVSEATQWLLFTGYLLWGLFGILSESLWVAAPSVVSIPLALATIVIVRRGRRLPPLVTSVSIIAIDEPLSVTDTTGSIPIISSDESGAVGVIAAPHLSPTTVTTMIIAADDAAVGEVPAQRPFTTTTAIPVIA